MIKTQVYLDREQFVSLKYSAAKNKTSYAELIRKAVGEYLNKIKTVNSSKISWSQKAKDVSTSMGGNLSKNLDEELYS